MARIAGVNLSDKKHLWIALTSIYWIWTTKGKQIAQDLSIDYTTKIKDLTEDQLTEIRNYIVDHFIVEGDLRRTTNLDIKRLKDIRCYRWIRHRLGLPVRWQKTHSNGRCRRKWFK